MRSMTPPSPWRLSRAPARRPRGGPCGWPTGARSSPPAWRRDLEQIRVDSRPFASTGVFDEVGLLKPIE